MNFFDLFLGIALIAMAICYIVWAVEDSRNNRMGRVWIDIAIAIFATVAGISNIVTTIMPAL